MEDEAGTGWMPKALKAIIDVEKKIIRILS